MVAVEPSASVASADRLDRPSASRKAVPEPDSETRSCGRSGDAGHHGGEVEFDGLGEDRLRPVGQMEEALRPGVGVDQIDVVFVPAGEAEVVEGDIVDGEDGAGGAVLGGHVADGGPVLQRDLGDPGSVELDELAHHAVLAEQLGDGEDEVGGGGAGRLAAGEAEAHHRREEHGQRLAEHGGLGLDAAHPPAQHAEPIDHGGVGVGADQGVAVGAAVVGGEDHPCEVLEVDLVTDAGAGWHHPKAVEGLLGPAQQLVALDVPLILDVDVGVVRPGGPRRLGDHRVVHHQLHRHEGVDLGGVTAQLGEGVAHGGQVHHAGDPGEVLHQDPLGGQGDLGGVGTPLAVPFRSPAPVGHRLDITRVDGDAVLVTEEVLQHHLDGVRQAGDVEPVGQGIDPIDLVGGVTHRQLGAGAEGVRSGRRGG